MAIRNAAKKVDSWITSKKKKVQKFYSVEGAKNKIEDSENGLQK